MATRMLLAHTGPRPANLVFRAAALRRCNHIDAGALLRSVAVGFYDGFMTATLALVPLLSVLAGAAITYWLNVRTRNRTRIEDIYHDAIAAVAVAAASKDFITQVGPWHGATNAEYDAFTSRLGQDGNERYVKAVADARSAIARASAYEPGLRRFYAMTGGSEFSAALADAIIAAIRQALARRSRSRFAFSASAR